MAKKKTTAETAVTKQYKVLRGCGNSETGAEFLPGDIVTTEDFSQAVIDNWLQRDPPVLEEVE